MNLNSGNVSVLAVLAILPTACTTIIMWGRASKYCTYLLHNAIWLRLLWWHRHM